MVERITQKHLGLGESAAEHNRNADHVQVHVNGESYRYEGVMTSLWLASENYREYRRAQERTREKRWRDADKRHTPAHPEYVPAKPAQFLEHGSGPGTFISYSRVDYHVASRLTEVLSMAGQNYWWDDGILPGEIWEARLREKLAAARCILVLWSRSSPASKWIQLEAGEGYRRGILLNLKLDESSIPEPFLKAETFDFCGCAFALNAPLTRSLLSRLGQMLGSCLIF